MILPFSINLRALFCVGGGLSATVIFAYKTDSCLNDGYYCCFMVAIKHSNLDAEI